MTSAARRPRRPRSPARSVLAMPLALLVASVAGLVIGLTGDGLRDAAAAALLALPLLALVLAWSRRG
ncbi:hypothetical protein [Qipengyuania sp.]|uniref:hypothetical protein n=1 Tax=Qipengyuania sp. TaxID=2004515 RepID=UPI00373638F8